MSGFQQFIQNIAEIRDRVAEVITPENLRAIREIASKLREWAEAEKELNALYGRVNASLADRGWYVAGEIPAFDYLSLANAFQDGDDEDVERIILTYARSRIAHLSQEIQRTHPKRHAIISDAIEAHAAGKFSLSIPTFLAQADGICREVFGRFFFSRRGGRLDELAKTLVVEECFQSMLTPLHEPRSLQADTERWKEERRRDSRHGPLNRHGVVHGTELEYATEGNSLRAALLIGYLIEIQGMLSHAASLEEAVET